MYTDTGVSDIVSELKRFRFQVRELAPEDTVSGTVGFEGIRDGVVIRYDGTLYVNNEIVKTPYGEFDITLQDCVHWFLNNFDQITKVEMGESDKDPRDIDGEPTNH